MMPMANISMSQKLSEKNSHFKHLVLVGLNYQPRRSSGDKNFWVELMPLLAGRLRRITIFSIRKEVVPFEAYVSDGCQISVKYLSPKFLETPGAQYERPRIFWRKGPFPSWLGVAEKALSGRKIRRELGMLYTQERYDHIHLMDNLGLANRLIAKSSPVSVSVSVMAYMGRGKFLYHRYLLLSYNHPNLMVVPYSRECRNKLVEIGVNHSAVKTIRWGVPVPDENKAQQEKRKQIKKLLHITPEKTLILWAGYLQQVRRRDFLYAYRVAQSALNAGLDAQFFFSFKPECFEGSFKSYNRPESGIIVKPTSIVDFERLKNAADILFSPVLNYDCILAPPLTWLELLALGVPIVTTGVPGVREAIVEGKTGFIGDSENELCEKLFLACKTYSQMYGFCQELVQKKI